MISNIQKLKTSKAKKITSYAAVDYSFLTNENMFPIVAKATKPGIVLSDWITSNRTEFDEKLNEFGAILFRGFDVDTVEKFESFTEHFSKTPLEYKLRSSPRYSVGNNVYHTTTYPSEYKIQMHSENSYAPTHPSYIVFCCIHPAEKDGETPIADNRKVLRELDPVVREKFRVNGVKYLRNLNSDYGLSWQEVFQTENKEEVAAICKNQGIAYNWVNDNQLTISWSKKAIWEHPRTGEEIWFNHAAFFNKYAIEQSFYELINSEEDLPNNTFYGDDSEITEEEIKAVFEAYEKATTQFSWQKGDVLFLDNMLASHGRNSYEGFRKIVTSLF